MTIAPLSATLFTCCKRPDIANMDHKKYVPSSRGGYSAFPRVNRCCLNCWEHWYGPPNAVKRYSRGEWDDVMQAAFEVEKAPVSAV